MTPYDHLAYTGKTYLQTHPSRMAAVARLFGLAAPEPDRARVLEIGCGDGVNLIAMAAGLPGAAFVGIDLAPSAIESGRRLALGAGLRNVSLQVMDLADTAALEGEFDFIVAHGVYSWVPAPVRGRLLPLCRSRLRPGGLALITYACYPGGHLEELLRRPMQIHAAGGATPSVRVERGREFALVLARHAASARLKALLEEQCDSLRAASDAQVFHDHLAECYAPLYFSEFAAQARSAGLEYVAEADPAALSTRDLEPEALAAVTRFSQGDRLAREQYLDLLRFRRFRQSLLTNLGAAVLDRPDPRAVADLWVGAPAVPNPVTTTNPVLRSALDRVLDSAPAFLPYRSLSPDNAADDAALRATFVEMFFSGAIELRATPPSLEPGVTERPRATALARAQAAAGASVSSLLHYEVALETQFARTLLTMLTGRRTRREIGDELAAPTRLARDELDREIAGCLESFRRHGLLC